MRRLPIMLVWAAAIATAAVAYGQLLDSQPPPTSKHYYKAVGVKGDVEGLLPGEKSVLKARVRNRSYGPVVVQKVKAKVKKAAPGCGAKYLKVSQPQPNRRLKSHEKFKVKIDVKIKGDAPAACEGARWPIEYSASAKFPKGTNGTRNGAKIR